MHEPQPPEKPRTLGPSHIWRRLTTSPLQLNHSLDLTLDPESRHVVSSKLCTLVSCALPSLHNTYSSPLLMIGKLRTSFLSLLSWQCRRHEQKCWKSLSATTRPLAGFIAKPADRGTWLLVDMCNSLEQAVLKLHCTKFVPVLSSM